MKRQLLVGSALALLMTAAPTLADTSATSVPAATQARAGVVLLAQDDEAASPDALLPKKRGKKPAGAQAAPEPQGQAAPLAEPQPKKQRKPAAEAAAPAAEPQAEPAQQAEQIKPKKQRKPVAEEAAPAGEPAQQAEQIRPKKQRKPVVEEAAPAGEPAQQAEQIKPKKQRKPVVEQAAPADQPAQQAEQIKPKKHGKPAPVEEAAPAPQAEPSQQAEQLKPKKGRKPTVEEAAPSPEPGAEPAQQAEQVKPKKQQRPAAEEPAPAAQPETEPAEQAEQLKPKKGGKPATEEAAPAEGQTAEEPKPKGTEEPGQQTGEVAPGKKKKPVPGTEETGQTGEQAGAAQAKPKVQPNVPVQEEAPGTATAEQPTPKPKGKAAGTAEPEAPATATGTEPAGGEGNAAAEAQPKNAAPVLDSAKEVKTAKQAKRPADQTKTGAVVVKPRKPTAPPAPPPADDRAAQAEVQPDKVETVTAEQGRRVSRAPAAVPLAETRPQGVDILKEIGDRVVIQIANQVVVQSSDRPRLSRGARDVYYEDLPGGRTRETVVREDGTQVVTIRNEYGDIIRRSRITEDGREYVLAYVDDRDYQRVGDWRDPGDDLPPMQLDVPTDEYVLDADNVEDPDTYYQFLERPPVERVERLYSVDEVKRSARIRDKIPRIELDTVTFEFGAATIEDSQVAKLQGVAEAMERLLKKNPAETFLIEGHTDAVGSDVANLALSDQRAEAVAQALTNVFGIAPENLATQGYGERYLKVDVDGPERLNRRVVIRRITPLVAPIASAE